MLMLLTRTGISNRKSGKSLDRADARMFCDCVTPRLAAVVVAMQVVAVAQADRLTDNEMQAQHRLHRMQATGDRRHLEGTATYA